MNRGGVENWLACLLATVDPVRLRTDFLVETPAAGDWDERVQRLGGRLICRAGGSLRRILERHGPYDIVHSHVHFASGRVLRAAARAGVPIRIAHSHTDSLARDRRATPWRAAYLALGRHWIARHATLGLAASTGAERSLFGSGWAASGKIRIVPCGIELESFAQPAEKAAVRRALGIAPDAFVAGHVGRFVWEKNHEFLLQVARALPECRLLLIGDGPLRPVMEKRARALGIAARVVFAGSRDDVPRLLQALDCFLFPSRAEGLGLALVEAQAAGLAAVVSEAVPEEADVVPGLVRRLPLEAGPRAWADAARATRSAHAPSREAALEKVRRSPLSLANAARQWRLLYESECATAGAAS